MAELRNEIRADESRQKRQGTKKMVMGALLAVLVAGGAYILFTSGSGEQDVAQSEISAPAFTPSALPPPTALPPVPLPDATPTPEGTLPAPATAPTP